MRVNQIRSIRLLPHLPETGGENGEAALDAHPRDRTSLAGPEAGTHGPADRKPAINSSYLVLATPHLTPGVGVQDDHNARPGLM